MNVDIQKDPSTLTMTVIAELDADVERAWKLLDDPRQLERWWGPPTYPATVVEHDLRAGGRVSYFMTGPEGDRSNGYWEVVASEPPHRLEVLDGFAGDDGTPNDAMPKTTMVFTLTAAAGGTTLRVATHFPSLEAMEQLVAMGMEEGIRAATGQIEAILAGSPAR